MTDSEQTQQSALAALAVEQSKNLITVIGDYFKRLAAVTTITTKPNFHMSVEKPVKAEVYDLWLKIDDKSSIEAVKQLIPFRDLLALHHFDEDIIRKMPSKQTWVTVKCTKDYLENIPQIDPKFTPDFVHVNKILDLVNRRNSVGYGRGYYGFGEAGTGKTSMALWFAAVVGQPIVQYNCNETSEIDDLFTRQVPMDGQWVTVDGPAGLPPAINDLIEGHKYSVSGVDQQIQANDNFRLFAFGNTGFTCSERANYNGRSILDASLKSRCVVDKYESLSNNSIAKMLLSNYPSLGLDLSGSIAQFMQGINLAMARENIAEVVTPRNIQMFAEAIVTNKELKNPLIYALCIAFPYVEECDDSSREAVLSEMTAHFEDILPKEDINLIWEERYEMIA